MEKLTLAARKNLGKKVLHAVMHQLLADGTITRDDLKDENKLFLKTHRILKKSDFGIVIDYRESILKEAERLTKTKQLSFSIIYFAMFFEHTINGIISHQIEKLKLSNKSKLGLIKGTNIESKLSWVLEILHLPIFNKNHLKTIIEVSEIRNSIIHYKWTVKEEKPDKDEERENILLIAKIKKTIAYMKSFESKILYNKNKSRLKKVLTKKTETSSQNK